jgi:hypothetical protein
MLGAPFEILFTVVHGGGNGLLTIARGTVPLALFGAAGDGLRTGLLSAPARILQGIARLLFSLVLDDAGPIYALALTGTLTGAASIALLLVRAPDREPSRLSQTI